MDETFRNRYERDTWTVFVGPEAPADELVDAFDMVCRQRSLGPEGVVVVAGPRLEGPPPRFSLVLELIVDQVPRYADDDVWGLLEPLSATLEAPVWTLTGGRFDEVCTLRRAEGGALALTVESTLDELLQHPQLRDHDPLALLTWAGFGDPAAAPSGTPRPLCAQGRR